MPKLLNGNNGDSNPGSLDCESGILPTELPRSTQYDNNTPNQAELYMDTLHQLSLMIEETSGPTPFCVVGDMNAELPLKATMQQNWYKQRPFNRNSVLLYDFMCDHELMENVT